MTQIKEGLNPFSLHLRLLPRFLQPSMAQGLISHFVFLWV